MESLKKFFRSSIVTSSILIVLGILLVFKSEFTIMAIAYITGAILIALGVIAFIRFIRSTNTQRSELDIIYGLVTIILGILVIKSHEAIASIIPFVIGVGIIISGSTKLLCAYELKNNENPQWKITMITSIVSVICGSILLFNPFKGAVVITQIVGLFIILYGILDIISTVTIKKNIEAVHQAIEGNMKDADIVDEENVDEEESTDNRKKRKKSKDK